MQDDQRQPEIITTSDQAQPHLFWCRITCDADLELPAQYVLSAQGSDVDGAVEFDTCTWVVLLQASDRAQALSQLLADAPGAVISICHPVAEDFAPSRFHGMVPRVATVSIDPASLIRAGEQLGRIAASEEAHRLWQTWRDQGGHQEAAQWIIPSWPKVMRSVPGATQKGV